MPWNQDRRRFFSLISPLRFRPYYAPSLGEFTTLILMRAFFTSSLRTSGPIRQAKGGWTSSDETLRQAVCKFNGKSWKKIAKLK
ncbi:uncharacterized protein LOC125587947 isoform X6 [Brassica napus]|uniref:uncharacterized protein LOC125587947 isoform X6 n=1 Tax=Brassica napus TaxID=3708 RepID=UPI002079DFBE|nr:uncharacterized protein LOC125587947 isoform X6 [Brassica napus]